MQDPQTKLVEFSLLLCGKLVSRIESGFDRLIQYSWLVAKEPDSQAVLSEKQIKEEQFTRIRLRR